MPGIGGCVSHSWLRRSAFLLVAALMIGLAPVVAVAEEDCGPITSSVVMTEALLACWDGWIIGDDDTDDITVDLDGLTITGRGIYATGANITVRNGTLHGTDAPRFTTGINAAISTDAVLEDLTIIGYSLGVELGARTSLRNSHLEGNGSGAFNYWGYDAWIRDNRFKDNRWGIAYISGGGATITGNHFEGNRAGVQAGISADGGLENSIIRSNRFERNGFGVAIEQFLGANDVMIEDNEILASESSGIAVISIYYNGFTTGGGRNVTIRNNVVEGSGTSPETVTTCLSEAEGCVSRLANDGITVLAWDPAIPPTITVAANRTIGNAGHGIYAPGVTDGGGNLATANGSTPPCVGVNCVDESAEPTFPDVPAGHAFHDEIAWMVNERITTGFDDGTFRPTAPVSRQAMAAFLYRQAGEPAVSVDAGFTDVPTDHPFHDEIAWMVNEGITTGFNDGTFRPTAPVSRQAMAAFLYRQAGEPAVSVDAGFTDVPTDHPFHDEIAWMVNEGITTGLNDGTFRSTQAVTRQAAAAFLYRAAGD